MADFKYGVQKVNGSVFSEEALTLSLDFWTVTTAVNILTANDPSGNGSAASAAALNKLVEVVSERGQPVILNAPTVSNGVYSLSFAIEHQGSWGTDGTMLVSAIKADGVNYGFGTDNTLAATLTSTLTNSL